MSLYGWAATRAADNAFSARSAPTTWLWHVHVRRMLRWNRLARLAVRLGSR